MHANPTFKLDPHAPDTPRTSSLDPPASLAQSLLPSRYRSVALPLHPSRSLGGSPPPSSDASSATTHHPLPPPQQQQSRARSTRLSRSVSPKALSSNDNNTGGSHSSSSPSASSQQQSQSQSPPQQHAQQQQHTQQQQRQSLQQESQQPCSQQEQPGLDSAHAASAPPQTGAAGYLDMLHSGSGGWGFTLREPTPPDKHARGLGLGRGAYAQANPFAAKANQPAASTGNDEGATAAGAVGAAAAQGTNPPAPLASPHHPNLAARRQLSPNAGGGALHPTLSSGLHPGGQPHGQGLRPLWLHGQGHLEEESAREWGHSAVLLCVSVLC